MLPTPKPIQIQEQVLGLVLRVGLFVLIVIMAAVLLPLILVPIVERFAGAALTVFGAGAISNAITYRIYERSSLMDAGLDWATAGSRRNLLLGIGLGAGFGLIVVLILVVMGQASFEHSGSLSWSSLLFVTLVLMFGAVGEELMFRGYGFQLLASKLGPFATLLPMAIVFGFAHIDNLGSTPLSVINTVGWGLLLGYATLKSHGLWLPIGIHYGWNWILPVLGANLSGFKMGVTGLHLNAAENSWGGGAYGPEASLMLTLLLPGLFYLVHRIQVAPQQALLLRGLDDKGVEEAGKHVDSTTNAGGDDGDDRSGR